MGTAHIIADGWLWYRLVTMPHLTSRITVLTDSLIVEPDIWLLMVESSLLPDGYGYCQELIVEDEIVRFKRDADT